MNEDNAIPIGREQRPHHIHNWSTDPAGAELGGGKHDHLRLALRDRVGDTGLMQPGIRRLTRIDLAQVTDLTGDGIAATRCWRPRHGCGGDLEDIDAQARGRNWSVALLRAYLEAPGAGTHKGHRRGVDALHIGRLTVPVPCPVWMNVHTVALLDDLQFVVEGRRLRRELRLLVADIVYPHGDAGIVEELIV